MRDYQGGASLLKAIAHPVRLQIVDILWRSPECVCHLSAALARSQPYISQQLAVLRSAGVIVDEREGTNVFYRLSNAEAAHVVEAMFGSLPAADAASASGNRQAVAGCTCPKCADNPVSSGA